MGLLRFLHPAPDVWWHSHPQHGEQHIGLLDETRLLVGQRTNGKFNFIEQVVRVDDGHQMLHPRHVVQNI